MTLYYIEPHTHTQINPSLVYQLLAPCINEMTRLSLLVSEQGIVVKRRHRYVSIWIHDAYEKPFVGEPCNAAVASLILAHKVQDAVDGGANFDELSYQRL